ncbi:hypothetical protein LSS_22305 [Leptospira santarosai serovar Shermani str. LT 821]|uniref:Uncharacterized protein n=1 Tax=Leptospira santarosai serovar Shermani str. LT 821 TaxID=758847 RepID=A0A097ESR9_9LEPT|nr:hypothetical protein LSS_22305 [Leptospira santarosai serovar Shermani str. LT 821]
MEHDFSLEFEDNRKTNFLFSLLFDRMFQR